MQRVPCPCSDHLEQVAMLSCPQHFMCYIMSSKDARCTDDDVHHLSMGTQEAQAERSSFALSNRHLLVAHLHWLPSACSVLKKQLFWKCVMLVFPDHRSNRCLLLKSGEQRT